MKYIKNLDSKSKCYLYELIRTSQSFKVRQRAHAILLSAKRHKIDELAEIFDVDRDTISEWFKRWEKGGMASLKDAPRSGRPTRKSETKRIAKSETLAKAV